MGRRSTKVLDEALVFCGKQLEGVDEARVEEFRSAEGGQQGPDVPLLGDPPYLGERRGRRGSSPR